eukprot:GFYU01040655.1.p1 GENE.GFYU01040655.1~~GFYU01040655.1.p1  ORF type:complete len:137 (-),score=33.83 GFYU01040655.1:43-408(-)
MHIVLEVISLLLSPITIFIINSNRGCHTDVEGALADTAIQVAFEIVTDAAVAIVVSVVRGEVYHRVAREALRSGRTSMVGGNLTLLELIAYACLIITVVYVTFAAEVVARFVKLDKPPTCQ